MKILFIALKDTLITFRDRNAVLIMIVAPLVMSFIMGAAFGGQGNANNSPIQDIPVIIVNHDEGDLGAIYAEVFDPENIDRLFAPQEMTDLDAALELVETGEVRGVVYIPAGFSASMEQSGDEAAHTTVELYTDPTASVSPFVLKAVVEQITSSLNVAVISQEVTASQIEEYAQVLGPQMAALGPAIAETFSAEFGTESAPEPLVTITRESQGEAEELNLMGYFAPSMAIFFLMFTVFDSTRSILEEETQTLTLQRSLTTSTRISEFLLGKILGTLLIGVLQMGILVLATGLIFRVDWGNPAALVLLILATVLAATSLGSFVASFARDNQQAAVFGTLITLVFAILGGNFFSFYGYSGILNILSHLTINRWALEGFTKLSLEKIPFVEALPYIGVLSGIALAFFLASVALFRRRFVR